MGLKRSLAEAVAARLDCYILPRIEAADWPERRFAAQLFDYLRPDCVFDVGANGGQYGRELRARGFTGTILSFEPAPKAFARLEAAAAGDARWFCHNLALGSAEGTLPFHVMAADDFSSFRAPSSAEDATFVDSNRVVATLDVPVSTLDAQLPALQARHGFSNPFLKMDTQGFDAEVAAGGRATLTRFCGLLSEVAVKRLYEGAPDLGESIARYQTAGFDLAALHQVNPEYFLGLLEYNCYCVRRDLVPKTLTKLT